MADPIEPSRSSRTKWLWLLILILLGVVLLVWLFRAESTEESPLEVDAPIGIEEESALPTPDEDAIDVELPDSDFELPETATETE